MYFFAWLLLKFSLKLLFSGSLSHPAKPSVSIAGMALGGNEWAGGGSYPLQLLFRLSSDFSRFSLSRCSWEALVGFVLSRFLGIISALTMRFSSRSNARARFRSW